MDGASSVSGGVKASPQSKPTYHSPPLAPFGITRTADLTDLDTIGLPVWIAVRPNSRALSLSQGKGLTHEHARISAIMESIEGAVAEQTGSLIAEFGTPAEMVAQGHRLVSLQDLARCNYQLFDPHRQRAWVRGVSYEAATPVFAPYELVGLDMRIDFPWDHDAFGVASNGLAAGPDFNFAALAALLELVERDATAPVERFGLFGGHARQIVWQSGFHAGLDEAMHKVIGAGLEPRLFEIPSKTGLPVAGAVIARPVLHEQGAGERLSGGYACRIDAGDAALAALLEAVQSRLTNIAGSRDDLEVSEYETAPGSSASSMVSTDAFTAFIERYANTPNPDPRGKLELAIKKLAFAGYTEVNFFDLPGPIKDVHVVRALIPGLGVL